ncbi:MAG: DUF1002 domain-containing protein [Clostridia bacterium]|nr:DUF1002 domain-containing protein [Clostridia bacterium]
MLKRMISILLVLLMLCSLAPLALAEGEDVPAENGSKVLYEGEASPVPAEEGAEESTPLPEVTAAPEATLEPESTAEPEPTPTAEPTLAPVPATPEPSATPAASQDPQAAEAPAADPEPTATPGPAVLDACVTMGADLTKAQRKAVYTDFGIEEGSVKELLVTNAEERAYLEGLIPDRKIGSVALSCIYIQRLEAGAGLTIRVQNINYCTEEMYKNALTTAGITDAYVMVSAPFPVSGTGALTGAYKAYEDMTGTTLNDLAKAVGAEELVLTGELSEYIGSAEAAQLIGELKTMLDQTQTMTDEEVLGEMDAIAKMYSVSLTDGQKKQVLNLIRKLEGLDSGELQNKLTDLAKTAQGAGKAAETVSKVYESVKGFFASVGSFFSKIFGGKA